MEKGLKIIKPREKVKGLQARVEAFDKLLPHNWIMLFLHDNPEYKEQEGISQFLSNIRSGKTMHEETIGAIEAWVKTLKS